MVVTVYGQIPLPAFNWVKASQTEVSSVWALSMEAPLSPCSVRVTWLTRGCRAHGSGLVVCRSDSLRPGIVTAPVILCSQLHVHVVFDGNRVFQAQVKLWGVSEDEGCEGGGRTRGQRAS